MKQSRIFFFITFCTCLLLAFYTDHRWEDWYITFRASSNLATGKGFVFNPGEHIMSYTSPIGTIIPAFFKFIFSNLSNSDEFTIWAYRIFCTAMLSFVPFFIIRMLEFLKAERAVILFTLLAFVFNFLILDNTINGMESGLMVFFMAYLIFILITKPERTALHLTLCFAGLMYTRPDGFVYGGTLTGCFMLFSNNISGFSRAGFIRPLARALLFSALLFLPWLLWTWYYYGTPVPHTVIAKARVYPFLYWIKNCIYFLTSFRGADYLFMPPYSGFGDWGYLPGFAKFISLITSLYWINIKGNKTARIISLSTFLLIIYLNIISGQGAMPWYLPSVTLLSLIVLGLSFHDLIYFGQKINYPQAVKYFGLFTGTSILLFFLSTFCFGSIQMHYQQEIIEFGNRRKIGEWLKEHKKENDAVFMECLGYIGFFSEMKTYDFPGISSPEVVQARKTLNTNDYGTLIEHLKPNWIVLRPHEIESINNSRPGLLSDKYELAKVFDKRADVNASPVPFGKTYMLFDAVFSVYKNRE